MPRLNRDTVVALILLLVCAAFYHASFDIRDMGYESLRSSVWPRMTIAVLSALCLVYLLKSMRQGAQPRDGAASRPAVSLRGWFGTYRNAIWCFLAYFVFLVTLDYLGMLLGGILFVFATMSLLGEWSVRNVAVHAIVAVGTVGAMWAVFTFGLRVILPEGELFAEF